MEDSDIEAIDEKSIDGGQGQKLILDMSDEPMSQAISTFNMDDSKSSNPRYTALVLDTSGSMRGGEPMKAAREAAVKFINQVLSAKGDNYVSVISFNTKARVDVGFTDDKDQLIGAINNLSAGGSTNQDDALTTKRAIN